MKTGFLDALRERGVHLTCENGRVSYRAPEGVLNAEMLSRLRDRKSAIAILLDPDRLALAARGQANGYGWREEWAAERGLIATRLVNCADAEVTPALNQLLNEVPDSADAWKALGDRIRALEAELRRSGRLPAG